MSRFFAFSGKNTLTKTSAEECLKKLTRGWHWANKYKAQVLEAPGINLGCTGISPEIGTFRNISCMFDGTIFANDGTFIINSPADLARIISENGFEKTLNDINGNFSIAAYDHNTKALKAARDRVGIRPCYYVHKNDFFACASRPGALLVLSGVNRTLNKTFAALFAGSHYRTFDHDRNSSPYEEVKQLPAGHFLEYKNGNLSIQCYWQLEPQPDFSNSQTELAEEYCELLQKVIKDNLKLTDDIAFTLSGGMDSSSVMATAVKLLGDKQHAFSSVYEDPTFDESSEIASMLDSCVKEWHQTRLGRMDIVPIVRNMIMAHDEPVATATWLSHWLVCRDVADAGFKYLYGGLGGDELNAGEYEYFFPYFADLQKHASREEFYENIDCWAKYHDHPVWKKDRKVAAEKIRILTDSNTPGKCKTDYERLLRYKNSVNPEFFELQNFKMDDRAPFDSYLKTRTWQDLFFETAPCCLRAEDRQTQAHGLMNIDPFYDYRLVEFMFRIPGQMKINKGITKILLRDAMKNTLPEETRTRIKKTGWNAPAHIWFTGKQAENLKEMVMSKSFRASNIYNVTETVRIIDEHLEIVNTGACRENHMMFLWQLLNMELWLQDIENFKHSDSVELEVEMVQKDAIL